MEKTLKAARKVDKAIAALIDAIRFEAPINQAAGLLGAAIAAREPIERIEGEALEVLEKREHAE